MKGVLFRSTHDNSDTAALTVSPEDGHTQRNTTNKTFVRGIRMDIKAVRNAMIYPVSIGITEGFINKLKTIKRVMYGKAKLSLLKIKIVMPTWIFN